MPTIVIQKLRKISEEERIIFFFNAIVAHSTSVEQLEFALKQPRAMDMTIRDLSLQIASHSAQLDTLSNMLDAMTGFAQPAIDLYRRYCRLPIDERINNVGDYSHQFDSFGRGRSENKNLVLRQHAKDQTFYLNVRMLIKLYAEMLYEEHVDPAHQIRLLQSQLSIIVGGGIITSAETSPILKMYMLLSMSIEPVRKDELKLLFNACLNGEIKEFAGLAKTRDYIIKLKAEVAQNKWNSMKSKMTLLGDGKTPGGIKDIRAILREVPDEVLLTNPLVKTFFSNVLPKLAAKANQKTKPMRRSEVTNNFYLSQHQEAAAIDRQEFQPFMRMGQQR